MVVQSLSMTWCHQRSPVPRAAALGGYSMPYPGVLQKQHPWHGGSWAGGTQGGMAHPVQLVWGGGFCKGRPCHVVPCHATPHPAEPCRAVPCHGVVCCAMLCSAMLCHVRCHAIPYHAMPLCAVPYCTVPCHAMPCHAVLCLAGWLRRTRQPAARQRSGSSMRNGSGSRSTSMSSWRTRSSSCRR